MTVARLLIAVIAAISVFSTGTLLARSATVPAPVHARIHAVMSPYDYLPASLPRSVRYINWIYDQPAGFPQACGQVLAVVFAAAGGKRIEWSSSRDCASNGQVNCFTDGYPNYGFGLPVTRQTVINGRRVFFSQGNHGSNAWACIGLRTSGFADMAVAGLWESGFLTPRQAMSLVAFARH